MRPNRSRETWEHFLVFISFLSHFSFCFWNYSWKESMFWLLLIFLRPFSVCFGSFWNKSVCFGCFKIHSKHRNKPKQNFHWFRKWTETNAKQILFRLFSVRTEIFFYLFRGHPTQGLMSFMQGLDIPMANGPSNVKAPHKTHT